MVVRTAKNGYKWIEPPYTAEEQWRLDRFAYGPPIAIYRGRETPDTASQSPPPKGNTPSVRPLVDGTPKLQPGSTKTSVASNPTQPKPKRTR
jgi:hypothetical protein